MSRWRRDLVRVSRHGDKRSPQTIRATESVENSEFAGEARVNSTFQVAESSEQAIPRADGGLVAWKFLFAAFMMEAIQWGRSPLPALHKSVSDLSLQALRSLTVSSRITTLSTNLSKETETFPSLVPWLLECFT